jgi:hypothetical protein
MLVYKVPVLFPQRLSYRCRATLRWEVRRWQLAVTYVTGLPDIVRRPRLFVFITIVILGPYVVLMIWMLYAIYQPRLQASR